MSSQLLFHIPLLSTGYREEVNHKSIDFTSLSSWHGTVSGATLIPAPQQLLISWNPPAQGLYIPGACLN